MTIVVGAEYDVEVCESETACNSMLFPCLVTSEGCESSGELAVAKGVGGLKTASLGVGGLEYGSFTMFVCSIML